MYVADNIKQMRKETSSNWIFSLKEYGIWIQTKTIHTHKNSILKREKKRPYKTTKKTHTEKMKFELNTFKQQDAEDEYWSLQQH